MHILMINFNIRHNSSHAQPQACTKLFNYFDDLLGKTCMSKLEEGKGVKG